MNELQSKKVLIVDDMADVRGMLRSTMINCGTTAVDMAGSVPDAMRRLSAREYDIILCDYNLGNSRNGQQFLEDLRRNQRIPLSTVFFMVTAERVYEYVVAAAELAPDDYLIKPFTAETLRLRLLGSLEKKTVFDAVYSQIWQQNFDEAIADCERIVANPATSKYTIDALRLKAELCMTAGRLEESQAIFEQVLAQRAVPWANLGLSRILMAKSDFAGAEQILTDTLAANRNFIGAYDLLANVQCSLGKLDEAQKTLINAVERSPRIVSRQRRLGELATRNGDMDTAETAFRAAIDCDQNNISFSGEDYASLIRICLAKGDIQGATATYSKMMQNTMRGDNGRERELVAGIVSSLIKAAQGKSDESKAQLNIALAALQDPDVSLSDELTLDLAHACYLNGEGEKAAEFIRSLVRNKPDAAALKVQVGIVMGRGPHAEEAIKVIAATVDECAKINNQGVQMVQAGDIEGAMNLFIKAADTMGKNTTVLLNAIRAMTLFLDKNGWDEALGQKARDFLGRVYKAEPYHSKYAPAANFLRETAKRFGVS